MARYSPGEWFAIVTPGGVALLPPTVPAATIEQVWTALRAGQGLGAVIEGLVGAFGTSLSLLPDFAVLVGGPEVRVAVRGAATARLVVAGEPVEITGSGVTTWSEQALAGVSGAVLLASGDAPSTSLPVADGIVLASRLELTDAPRTIPARDSIPEPDEGPASIPEPDEGPASIPEPDEGPASIPDPDEGPASIPDPDEGPASIPDPDEGPASIPDPDEGPASIPEVGRRPSLEGSTPSPEPTPEPATASETTWVEPADDAAHDFAALLFGETVLSSVEAAAVREPEPELTVGPPGTVLSGPGTVPGGPGTVPGGPGPAGPASPVVREEPVPPVPVVEPVPPAMIQGLPFVPPASQPAGDHDGQTVIVDEQRADISVGNSQPTTPLTRNPPVLLIPGQGRVVLDRGAIVGTRPQLSRVQGSNVPHLVTVASPSGEISRNHLELRVEGATVLAVDLNSTNGTMLLRAGGDPVRLHPGEPSILVPGDRIDLGDGVVLGFEGLA